MDDIIVTLLFSDGYEPVDLEIPAKLQIDELEDKILESLIEMDFERFGGVKKINLSCGGKALEPDKTLEEYGIWDGSKLTVSERRV